MVDRQAVTNVGGPNDTMDPAYAMRMHKEFSLHELTVMADVWKKMMKETSDGRITYDFFRKHLKEAVERGGVVYGRSRHSFWASFDFERLFTNLDTNEDGELSKDEFLSNYRFIKDAFYNHDKVFSERPYFWESDKREYQMGILADPDKAASAAAGLFKAAVHDHSIKLGRRNAQTSIQRMFDLLHSTTYFVLRWSVVLIHALLAIWEAPQIDDEDSTISTQALKFIELGILLFYALDLGLKMAVEGPRVYLGLVDASPRQHVVATTRFGESSTNETAGIFRDTGLHEKEARREERTRFVLINRVNFVVVFLIALDVFLALFGAVTFRYSRVLRPTLGVIYDRRLRRLLWTIVKSLPNVAYISLTLLLIFIMYAALGVQLFAVGNASETYFDEDGEPLEGNFNNFLDAILSLFVLSTTENYPSIAFPAMNKITFAYSLFFISFVVVVVFIMMQVLTATIFQNYASNAEDDILKRKKHELKGIVAAFQVLALSEHAVESALSTEDDVFIKDDVIRMSSVRTWMFNLEGAGVLRRGTARSLLSRWMTENQGVDDTATVLMKNRSSFKDASTVTLSQFISLGDHVMKERVPPHQFAFCCCVAPGQDHTSLDEESTMFNTHTWSSLSRSETAGISRVQWFRNRVWKLTHSRWFRWFILLCIITNAAALCLFTFDSGACPDLMPASNATLPVNGTVAPSNTTTTAAPYADDDCPSYTRNDYLDIIDLVTLIIFTIEMCLKIFGDGWSHYWSSSWNRLDAGVVFASFVSLAFWRIAFLFDSTPFFAQRLTRAISLLRILRIMTLFKGFRPLLLTFVGIRLLVVRLTLVVMIIMYFYAIIGAELFHGRFAAAAQEIQGPDYAHFDNFLWSMFSLFQIFTTSNWHEVLYHGIRATNGWAVLYFLSYYIINNILLFNIMVAIIWEVFAVEQRAERQIDEATRRASKIQKFAGDDKEIDELHDRFSNQLRNRGTDWEEKMLADRMVEQAEVMKTTLVRELAPYVTALGTSADFHEEIAHIERKMVDARAVLLNVSSNYTSNNIYGLDTFMVSRIEEISRLANELLGALNHFEHVMATRTAWRILKTDTRQQVENAFVQGALRAHLKLVSLAATRTDDGLLETTSSEDLGSISSFSHMLLAEGRSAESNLEYAARRNTSLTSSATSAPSVSSSGSGSASGSASVSGGMSGSDFGSAASSRLSRSRMANAPGGLFDVASSSHSSGNMMGRSGAGLDATGGAAADGVAFIPTRDVSEDEFSSLS